MERQFKIKPELSMVYLPECGIVQRNMIKEGDKYAKYLGTHLIEIFPPALVEVPVTIPVVEPKIEAVVSIPEFIMIPTTDADDIELTVEPTYEIQPVFNGAELLSVDEHIALAAKQGSEPGLVLPSSRKGRGRGR